METRYIEVYKDGKMINDLHYTTEGYQTLGERFAESSIALVKGTED